MSRQIHAIAKIIHNSMDNPVIYFTESDEQEKKAIKQHPFDTINDILQGNIEQVELMRGYKKLSKQFQKMNESTDADSVPFFGSLKHNIVDEKDMEALDQLVSLLSSSTQADSKMMTHSTDDPMLTHQSSIDTFTFHNHDETSFMADDPSDNLRIQLADTLAQLSTLQRQAEDLQVERNRAVDESNNIRMYATELQRHIEDEKVSNMDVINDLQKLVDHSRVKERELQFIIDERENKLKVFVDEKGELLESLHQSKKELDSRREAIDSVRVELQREKIEREVERSSLRELISKLTEELNHARDNFAQERRALDDLKALHEYEKEMHEASRHNKIEVLSAPPTIEAELRVSRDDEDSHWREQYETLKRMSDMKILFLEADAETLREDLRAQTELNLLASEEVHTLRTHCSMLTQAAIESACLKRMIKRLKSSNKNTLLMLSRANEQVNLSTAHMATMSEALIRLRSQKIKV